MDIRPVDAEATSDERAAVDAVLGAPRSSWDGGDRGNPRDTHTAVVGGQDSRARRHLLLPAFRALQARVGWISEGGLGYICDRLNVPPAEAWGVATFYALLATSPRPARVVHVCDDIACKCRGADEITAALERAVGPALGHGVASSLASPHLAPHASHLAPPTSISGWMRSPCLGRCDQAPAAFVTIAGEEPRESLVGHITADRVIEILSAAGSDDPGDGDGGSEDPPYTSGGSETGLDDPRDVDGGSEDPPYTSRAPASSEVVGRVFRPGESGESGDTRGTRPRQPLSDLRLLRRVGRVDPASLEAYRASGGFDALEKAIAMGPAAVIAEVTASRLMGRGGAAFPTGRKWDAVRSEPATPHYLICNADESEPGTFKDRVLMEEDPFAIVEAMTIAAFATDCRTGFVYVRGEYPLAAARLQHAIDRARAHGLLGPDILGRGVTFDIEIRRGAGAYICGEETALFESIEGRRGEPRNKPPFPVHAGLFGKPTVVNNVETLANVPQIVLEGGAAFAAIGTAQSTGTRVYCLSGNVRFPGVYEAPFGITLRALIEMAGGVHEGRTVRAVLLGGAAGTFVRPDELDLRLTHEDTRAAGTTLGSGVVMVIDDTVDPRALVLRIAAFFRDESCGQCVPCRVGTIRQEEALHRIAASRNPGGLAAELALLDEVGAAMRDASICGLGQTAYAAIESAIKRLKLYSVAGPQA